MKAKQQNHNWIVDVILFAGFLVCFFLDLTGVIVHEFLGAAVGLLAAGHLIVHWNWVKAVGARFFDQGWRKVKTNYLVDTAVMAGFLGIMSTGLMISSWLNLDLQNYEFWKNLHVISSITTMLVVVLKFGLHWKWIVSALGRMSSTAALTSRAAPMQAVPQPVTTSPVMRRRDFVRLMGVVSVLGMAACVHAAGSLEKIEQESSLAVADAQGSTGNGIASSSNSSGAASSSSTSESQTAPSTVCSVRCPRGCSYPGLCRKYQDSNGNGRCDLGECM